jgi:hypothetical protein
MAIHILSDLSLHVPNMVQHKPAYVKLRVPVAHHEPINPPKS